MRWALAGIFLLAGLGVLLAATTTIPSRATSTASARLSAGGDSVFVDAVFALRDAASIRAGQTMSFRPQDPGVSAVDLTILAVAPYPAKASSAGSARRVLVHGAILTNQIRGDVVTGIGAGGTAHVVIGHESLLHLFRPRTPGGVKP